MNSKLKNKNILLVFGFIFVLFSIYPLAIKKTVAYKKKHTLLKQEYQTYNNATQQLENLRKKDRYLDEILSKNKLSIHLSFQQLLLRKVNECIDQNDQQLDLIAFEKPHFYRTKNNTIQTYKLGVKGNFIATLKFINYLEKQRLGSIVSMDFTKTKNYRTRKEYLITTLYIQKISD